MRQLKEIAQDMNRELDKQSTKIDTLGAPRCLGIGAGGGRRGELELVFCVCGWVVPLGLVCMFFFPTD